TAVCSTNRLSDKRYAFFYQAEDGIRDGHVTGVQTCALPILEAIFAKSLDLTYVGPGPALNAYLKSNGEEIRVISGAANGGAALRSEERRVGKECRTRW